MNTLLESQEKARCYRYLGLDARNTVVNSGYKIAINIPPELQAQFQREDLEFTLFDGLKG